jgi:nucleotide-binding universal stress UspA family protein
MTEIAESAPGVIIVAFDGSRHAQVALAWAARTAAAEGRAVRAVAVTQATDTAGHDADHPDEELPTALEAAWDAMGVTGTFEQLTGSVESVLLQQSLDAHALVSGTRGRGRAADAFLGSVSQRLARHSSCPLIVVRPPSNPTAARIVAGVDGSPESITALRFACHRASFTNEPVVALHAWNPGHINVDDKGQLPQRVGQRSKVAEVLVAECIAQVRDEFPHVSIEPDTVPLTPTVALTEASARASLVVTGSRGRGVVTGLLLGSVSQHLLSHAHCPVAVPR